MRTPIFVGSAIVSFALVLWGVIGLTSALALDTAGTFLVGLVAGALWSVAAQIAFYLTFD